MADTIEGLLGPAPAAPQQPPATIEGLLGPRPQPSSMSGPGYDEYFSQGSAGNILDTFGHGFKTGFGSEKLGLKPETEEGLKKLGFFTEQRGPIGALDRGVSETLIRPSA